MVVALLGGLEGNACLLEEVLLDDGALDFKVLVKANLQEI
jgi:hypothetical protein